MAWNSRHRELLSQCFQGDFRMEAHWKFKKSQQTWCWNNPSTLQLPCRHPASRRDLLASRLITIGKGHLSVTLEESSFQTSSWNKFKRSLRSFPVGTNHYFWLGWGWRHVTAELHLLHELQWQVSLHSSSLVQNGCSPGGSPTPCGTLETTPLISPSKIHLSVISLSQKRKRTGIYQVPSLG